jgi:hypothetical protein
VKLLVHAVLASQLGHVQRGARVRNPLPRGPGKPVLPEKTLVVRVGIEPVAPCEVLDRDAVRRIFRMEVEGKPLVLSAVPALEPRRALNGDVAERSYVVGPDSNKGWHTSGLYPIVWLSRYRTQRLYRDMHAGVEGRIAGSSPAATPAYLVSIDAMT